MKLVGSILTRLCVLLLAATLLFSGFVKAVDPMGMCILLNAYFSHWGFSMPDDALVLKVGVAVLATVEFMLGVYLLLGIRRRLATRVTLLLISVLTLLTLYIYIYNPVSDCGCFGAALQLTNGQTLLKNVVLLAAALYLCFRPQEVRRLISERNQWLTSIWSIVYIVSLTLYSFHYLPLLEFTPFKAGASLRAALSDPHAPESYTDLANFYLATPEGEMVQDSLSAVSGEVFLLTLSDETTADDGCNDRINDLYDECLDLNLPFAAVLPEEQVSCASDWVDRAGAAYPILLGESTQLKAMVRSNPGLLLLKDGKIAAKWSNNNLPTSVAEAKKNADEEQRGPLRLLLWFVLPLLLFIVADNLYVGSKFYRHYLFIKQLKKQKT